MTASASPRIVYCNCSFARVLAPEVKTKVLEGLAASGRSFDAVPDLCEMSARKDPALLQIASGAVTIQVLANTVTRGGKGGRSV